MRRFANRMISLATVSTALLCGALLYAQDAPPPAAPRTAPNTRAPGTADDAKPGEEEKGAVPKAADPRDAKYKRLVPESEVWIDEKNKQVIVGGQISLQKGVLEMFACLKGTKEHESIIAANAQAYIVHAALLAVGAQTGSPVKFEPMYRPASGTEIEVTVRWTDAKGKPQQVKAQEWVRNNKDGKTLKHPWVFAGSGFWTDTDTGDKHYMAEGGDLICVSNFPSAMLDLPIESTQGNDNLLYEAFADKIPERGTKVELVLKPVLKAKAEGAKPEAKPAATAKPKAENTPAVAPPLPGKAGASK